MRRRILIYKDKGEKAWEMSLFSFIVCKRKTS